MYFIGKQRALNKSLLHYQDNRRGPFFVVVLQNCVIDYLCKRKLLLLTAGLVKAGCLVLIGENISKMLTKAWMNKFFQRNGHCTGGKRPLSLSRLILDKERSVLLG